MKTENKSTKTIVEVNGNQPNNKYKKEDKIIRLLEEALDKLRDIDSEIYSLKHALTCKDC